MFTIIIWNKYHTNSLSCFSSGEELLKIQSWIFYRFSDLGDK